MPGKGKERDWKPPGFEAGGLRDKRFEEGKDVLYNTGDVGRRGACTQYG
ncbi:hypothetical protein [uncultured Methanofollis sp.]|nr:hypothetical protein [uncultured Methanofollis sp.]